MEFDKVVEEEATAFVASHRDLMVRRYGSEPKAVENVVSALKEVVYRHAASLSSPALKHQIVRTLSAMVAN